MHHFSLPLVDDKLREFELWCRKFVLYFFQFFED